MTRSSNNRIVLLAGRNIYTNFVYNSLKARFDDVAVILEDTMPRSLFLKKRVKTLGAATVLGQVLFKILAVPLLESAADARRAGLEKMFSLDPAPIAAGTAREVPSANSETAIAALKDLAPAVVVVNGTRILSKEVLGCVDAPFINTHTGLTPMYRGINGGYWSLAAGDRSRCGVTIHLVDKGIDTGKIIEQAPIDPIEADNFTSYNHLMYGAALPLLMKAVQDSLDGALKTKPHPEGKSRLWSHPTLLQYLRARLLLGVK